MLSSIVIVIVLAIIQGLTEFLPVSSSGHLVIAEALMGTRDPSGAGSIIFEIAVHVGTLGAVIAVYRKKIYSIMGGLWRWTVSGFRDFEKNRTELVYIFWIVLGTIPAALVALTLKGTIESLFDRPEIASAFLIVTGLLLLTAKGRTGGKDLTLRIVVLIGIAQAVAILPGCSRSGWTISIALLAGIGFERAAEFSFMLSLPAILGALVIEMAEGSLSLTGSSVFLLVLGTVIAFISGLLALRLLIYILRRGSFYRFSWYLIPAGVLTMVYFMIAG